MCIYFLIFLVRVVIINYNLICSEISSMQYIYNFFMAHAIIIYITIYIYN